MGQCATINNRCSKCGFVASAAEHQSFVQAMKQHQCCRPKPILKENYSFKSSIGKLNEARKKQKIDTKSFMKIKVSVDNSNTKFKWIDQPLLIGLEEILKISKQTIKKGSFQEKLAWFRDKLQKMKKQSSRDFQLIKIDRQNIVKSSLKALQGINLMKELRIQFNGDSAQDAGGGLLRQWMHLCVKQIMSDSLGIFKQANTEETAYQFYWSNSVSDEDSFQALYLLGIIIGKALLQKIPINCCLDRTIIRQICSQPIHLCDVYSYDKAFYESWSSIFKMPKVDELGLDGTVYHRFSQSEVQQIQVFPNGKQTIITDNNKEMYISELINLYCTKSVQSYIDQLTNAIYSVIPAQLLQIFQPHQFEMLLNGPSNIDIKDWKNNTVYDNYEPQDQVIKWFWKIVEGYGQQGYRNLLHYCTGSNRVPILGFSCLETNRGHIKKFTIRKVQYDEKNPYPKSYTCFNRLDLPEYSSQQELRQKLAFIMEEQFTYFGLC